MTEKEAINWIRFRMCEGRGRFTENHKPILDEPWQAGEMAVKSIKAWDAVTEEIKAEIKSNKYDKAYGAGYEKGLYKALEIIETHLGGKE